MNLREPIGDARENRGVVMATLLVSAAMLGWMGRSLFTGEVPYTGDLLHFHYPLRQFYADALAAGDRFDWMPSLFNGFYLVGEGQIGAYHPLHWLLYRLLPLDTAFAIELIAAYPFLFVGTLLFLRQWCPPAPSVFGAMLFTFCGFNLAHGVHPNMVAIIAHAPWVLWAIHGACTGTRWEARVAGGAVVGLLTGSQLLLGHPQALWLSLLIEGAYTVMLLVRRPTAGRLWNAVAVVFGLLLGAAVGAIQLLATLYAVDRSARQGYDPSFATSFSLTPSHLFQVVEPYLFWGRVLRWTGVPTAGDEYAAYGGAVALVLTAWWLVTRWAGRRNAALTPVERFGLCAAGFGVVGLWLATGSHGRLYLLQTWLPVVGLFRVPARFIVLFHFALAVTSAIALSQLLRSRATGPRAPGVWAAWTVALISGAAAIWLAASGAAPDSGQRALAVAAGPALFAAAAGLLTLAVRGIPHAVMALVLLAGADQALYGLGGVIAWQDFLGREAVMRLPDTRQAVAAERGRLAHGGFPNLYTLAGYRFTDGYLGLVPARQLDYQTPQALRISQVAYLSSRLKESTQIPVVEAVNDRWYALAAPLPRARLVTRARVSQQPAVDLAAIDVDHEALTTHELSLAGDSPGTAVLASDAPGDIGVLVTTDSRQLLIVAESFDEGWHATLDNQPVPVERVNGDFLGCVVTAGTHEVRFQFHPAHLDLGAGISLSGFGLAIVLLGIAGVRTRGWWARTI